MSRYSLAPILLLLFARAAGAATISYEFTTLVDVYFPGYVSNVEASAAERRSYLDANPGASAPGWSGTLSYDSGTGELTVTLLFPDAWLLPGHPVDAGGSAVVGPLGDVDVLGATFPQNSGLEAFALFGGASYLQDETSLVLDAPGLFAGGELRSGLTGADLTRGYLWGLIGNVDAIPGCSNWLECMYEGGHQIYYNDLSLMLFSISELHQVPEPGVGLAPLPALALAAVSRARARKAR